MTVKRILRALFYLNVILVLVILGYKAYLNYFLPEFEGVHAEQADGARATVLILSPNENCNCTGRTHGPGDDGRLRK